MTDKLGKRGMARGYQAIAAVGHLARYGSAVDLPLPWKNQTDASPPQKLYGDYSGRPFRPGAQCDRGDREIRKPEHSVRRSR